MLGRVTFCGDGNQLTGLQWESSMGGFESPLSENIAGLDAISSVAYFDMLTMYGGDTKLIFDIIGRCGGSNWHSAHCDWKRDEPVDRKCNPLTPEMLKAWTLARIKCCSPDHPPLHNLSVDVQVPCTLHLQLGAVPYNVAGIAKFGTLFCTAGKSAVLQAQVEKLEGLGQQLAEVVMKQEETLQAWIVVSTPYTKIKELLDAQLAEQAAAQKQYRSNYNGAITLLRSKMRRYQEEVEALAAEQKEQAEKVVELNAELEAVRLTMDHDTLESCNWLRALMKEAMAAVGAAPQIYFGGTALVGNDCKRILGQYKKFLRILQEAFTERAKLMFTGQALEGWLKSIDEKFELWGPLFGTLDKFFAVANSSRRFTDQQLDAMDECMPVISGLWVHLYGDLASAPPKIHTMVGGHVMKFARKFRFFVHGGEQIGEKEHGRDNRHARLVSSFIKQYTRCEEAKDKYRTMEADPGQIAAANAADEKTRRKKVQKTSKKEENDGKKREIKTESRDCAVAAGRALLARLAASAVGR